MRLGQWQEFSDGSGVVVSWRGRPHSGWEGEFAWMNGQPGLRRYVAMARYMETDGLWTLEFFTALRPWEARRKAIRAIREARAYCARSAGYASGAIGERTVAK